MIFNKFEIVVHNISVSVKDSVFLKATKKFTEFAESLSGSGQSSEYYSNERNASKAFEDIILGKFGEMYAVVALNQFCFPIIKVDTGIYKSKQKNWNCDLPYPGCFPNFHVKTCNDFTKKFAGDLSWTFQYSNIGEKGGKDKLFASSGRELVALMHVPDYRRNEGILVATGPWIEISKHLRDPVSKKLIGLKKCVYYKDLQ